MNPQDAYQQIHKIHRKLHVEKGQTGYWKKKKILFLIFLGLIQTCKAQVAIT